MTLFAYIAERTNAYAYEDWVVPIPRLDREGNAMKRPILRQLMLRENETPPHNAHHRWMPGPGKRRFTVTANYVLAWFGILIMCGAYFRGDTNRGINNVYRDPPYGVSIPFIQNTMPRAAFPFMRQYIHFSNICDRVPKGQPGYDPLFKVRYLLNEIMSGMRKCWVAGARITIDESMIRYMGRAVAFVQYMPRKPIKHGIKVFAICCAYTAVLLGFEVYCGASMEGVDGSADAVVMRVIRESELDEPIGRTIYSDNWYTTVKLADALFEQLGWLFCGTITPTTKVARQDDDVPFHQLSAGAVATAGRGWFREAVIERATSTGKKYWIQCTSWIDRKQVMFLHTSCVGQSSGHNVIRRTKGKQDHSILPAPKSQLDYAEHYHAVDRSDRDSADYTVLFRTNRWYLRIVFWLVDRVVHLIYASVLFCVCIAIGGELWSKYKKKNGRYDVQIDLGMEITNFAIANEWTDLDGPRPDWMRQAPFIPCNCKKCFFCLNGLTTGICHPQERNVKTTFIHHDRSRTITRGCTETRINLERGNQYCRMCYRNQPDYNLAGEKMTSKMKKKAGHFSRLGCASCDEHVCDECWAAGYDRHN